MAVALFPLAAPDGTQLLLIGGIIIGVIFCW